MGDAWNLLRYGPRRGLASKAIHRAGRALEEASLRRRDREQPSYALDDEAPRVLLNPLEGFSLDLVRPHAETVRALADLHRHHRFDLLGSGWVDAGYGRKAPGLEGHRYGPHVAPETDPRGRWLRGRLGTPNLDEAQRAWSLVRPGYTPIDWQRDLKTGHRWSERTWFRDIRWGEPVGADVKVPWELGRMHHLTWFSWAHALGIEPADGKGIGSWAREFQDEVLDFVATNPPRWGVQWASSMDVAIRAANWTLAYDLFRAAGAPMDPAFEAVFRRSLFEHARHVQDHPDWEPDYRGNHYLANVVGLLFLAAHWPEDDAAAQEWHKRALRALARESATQFQPDGTHFEASTGYHALSSQLVAFGLAIALGREDEAAARLQLRSVAERIPAAARALRIWTRPDGALVQVGDQDSGRLFKPFPPLRSLSVAEARGRFENLQGFGDLPKDDPYWVEDPRDPIPVLDALDSIQPGTVPRTVDGAIVQHLSRGRTTATLGLDSVGRSHGPGWVGTEADWAHWEQDFARRPASERRVLQIPAGPGGLREGLVQEGLRDFGYFVFRSRRLWLGVRCGPIGQGGRGGHAHNDQLSVELFLDGAPVLEDPGSYLYTALPRRRNEYRSVRAHFAPQAGDREPGALDRGPFRLGNEARARCVYFGPRGFLGTHRGYGRPIFRRVELLDDAIAILDVGHGLTSFGSVDPGLEGAPSGPRAPPFSPAYGWRRREGPVAVKES